MQDTTHWPSVGFCTGPVCYIVSFDMLLGISHFLSFTSRRNSTRQCSARRWRQRPFFSAGRAQQWSWEIIILKMIIIENALGHPCLCGCCLLWRCGQLPVLIRISSIGFSDPPHQITSTDWWLFGPEDQTRTMTKDGPVSPKITHLLKSYNLLFHNIHCNLPTYKPVSIFMYVAVVWI